MPISIRHLTEGDLEAADAILSSAFQRSESWVNDLRLFQKLEPDGILLAYQHGIPAGMVASVNYSNYAYVGLMGVHQEFQRQGIGLALMEHLLSWLEQLGIHQVVLDASPLGQPLYERLGFVPFNDVYVLRRQAGPSTFQRPADIQQLSLQNLDLISAADKQAFGADRSRLLQALVQTHSHRACLLANNHNGVDGYLVVQEKRIGPWVMQNPDNAELLLRAALSLSFRDSISVVVPSENRDAVALLQRYGFETVRVNRHMVRGSVSQFGDRSKIFAQASLSLG
jgi:ribosomal protein S18 acetylase RimI-like enzyme